MDGLVSAGIVVAGAGPAGMAAAVRATECGRTVLVIDDNDGAGGQIWRGGPTGSLNAKDRKWFERLQASNAKKWGGARIVDGSASARTLRVETAEAAVTVRYGELILATGARELFLPFPGWTLPNVVGVGGIQALAKAGLNLAGKTVLIAGTGPLLLAVAAYLKNHGATVPAILEQARQADLIRFVLALARHPAKLMEAAALRLSLGLTAYLTDTWVTAVEREQTVNTAHVRTPKGTRQFACDFVAVGFGLTPNVELACLLGCAVRNESVVVDEFQRTSQPHVFCAGEATGIGGVEGALLEGEIAGCAAAGQENQARKRFRARHNASRFAEKLNQTFAPRAELGSLPASDTFVCRCEDVPLHRLRLCSSWREAKLHTRCGMGPCQGRICGPATRFLFGWMPDSVRPPIFPARVGSMIAETQFEETTNQ